MHRFAFIILLFLCVLTGCRTSRQIHKEYQQGTNTEQVIVKTDSVRHIHDTLTVTEYFIEQVETEQTTEDAMQEWWDNWTKSWTDSFGNMVTESHETGNRNTNRNEWNRQISTLQDSISMYKAMADYYSSLSDFYHITSKDTIYIKEDSQTSINKPSVWSFISDGICGVLLLVITAIFAYLYFKKQK